jgi:hypothetical protein
MCILTSDRDKGITAVEEELGQYIIRAIYCQVSYDIFNVFDVSEVIIFSRNNIISRDF